MNKILSVTAAIAAVGSIFLGGAAQAALMIEISDGTTTNTYTDQLGADLHPLAGILVPNLFVGIGNFTFISTDGQSKPFIGGASRPVMDLGFGVTSFGTGGTLTIRMTDTDFLIDSSSRGICGLGGLTTGGSVSYSCYYDSGNVAFDETSLIGDVGSISGVDGSQLVLANGLTSLTTVLRITHGAGDGIRTSGNADIVVPEPQTLALFGVGLLGLGFLARRRKARHLDD